MNCSKRGGGFMFGMFLSTDELGRLAPIVVVMLFCSWAFEALAIAFERIAGSPFLNCFIVPLQKKIELFKRLFNKHP